MLRYRTRLRLKKTLRFLLISFIVLVVTFVGLLIYADSQIVYDETGAHYKGELMQTEPTEATEPRPVVENPIILEQEQEEALLTIREMGGVYITTSMLRDIEKTRETVLAMEPCAVLMELKSIFGNFYYSSKLAGSAKADVNLAAIDSLIAELKARGFYLIASIPAFVDPAFALEHQSYGLPLSGGALWMDDKGCYWLDPAEDGVISYLMQIARELSGLGFREVAFSHFYFPDTDRIVYSSDLDKGEVIRQAAGELSSFSAGDSFVISFQTDSSGFPADSVNGRLYISNADGNQVERFVQAYGSSETLQEIVFLANSKDSRFEAHALLRPLLSE